MKFQVGDKVRLVDNMRAGAVYRVTDVYRYAKTVRLDDSAVYGEEELELVQGVPVNLQEQESSFVVSLLKQAMDRVEREAREAFAREVKHWAEEVLK
jgi:hypothetical protein